MKIGEKIIGDIQERVEHLTRAWQSDINDAYMKFGDDDPDFKLSYKATLKPSVGQIKVVVEISFPPGPNIKDTSTGYVDEDQLDLFVESKVISIEDRRGVVGRPPRFKGLGG